eukprot:TRINITY_DN12859_c0_g1_i1.p1 TRINITY_DN12859_c0_g1~~TRINITY_DN12859_c0_g1_i1.p1  ORF type:complete len:409 (-),score=53.62 TRINITY_DN12859_c0_g1_i1:318-1544(-)
MDSRSHLPVGLLISQHCSSHNDRCEVPSEEVFDLPSRGVRLVEYFSCRGAAVSSRVATDLELRRGGTHSLSYLRQLGQRSRSLQKKQRMSDEWAAEGEQSIEWEFLDQDQTSILTAQSEAAARSSVGCTLEAVDQVLAEVFSHVFVACRPPGHPCGCSELLERLEPAAHRFACHGGCILNETAAAIRHCQAQYAANPVARENAGVTSARVAVVDLDVHFGDGTALTFYDDPDVLHISVHVDQSDQSMFPFLVGKPEERGTGLGLGTTINLPLKPGDGDARAWGMFERSALTVLTEFRPRMIFLSCGFDGVANDPTLAGTVLTPNWFGSVAAACAGIAPVVATLQGGYVAEQVQACAEAVVAALQGDWATEPPSVTEEDLLEAEAIATRLRDSDGWWDVEQSFAHGLPE